jgi:hypothetical protein
MLGHGDCQANDGELVKSRDNCPILSTRVTMRTVPFTNLGVGRKKPAQSFSQSRIKFIYISGESRRVNAVITFYHENQTRRVLPIFPVPPTIQIFKMLPVNNEHKKPTIIYNQLFEVDKLRFLNAKHWDAIL